MTHEHIVIDTNPCFEIDILTREIKNMTPSKNVIMQFDHNSERFGFSMPRYIEGHDMSECDRVEVHFINEDGAKKERIKDKYKIKDLTVDPDDAEKIKFTWLLSGNTSKLEGNLVFSIRFICFEEEDGEMVDYSWGTAIYSAILVAKGLLNDEAIIAENPDAFAQMQAELQEYTTAQVAPLVSRAEAVAENATNIAEEVLQAIEQATGEGIIYPVGTSTTENEDLLIEINDNNYSITTKSTNSKGLFDLIGYTYQEISNTSVNLQNLLQTHFPSAMQEKPIFKKGQLVAFGLSGTFSGVGTYASDITNGIHFYDITGTRIRFVDTTIYQNGNKEVNCVFVAPMDIYAIAMVFNAYDIAYDIGITLTGAVFVGALSNGPEGESTMYPVGVKTIENNDLLVEFEDNSYSITTKSNYARGLIDLIGCTYQHIGQGGIGTVNLTSHFPSAMQEKPVFKKGELVVVGLIGEFTGFASTGSGMAYALSFWNADGIKLPAIEFGTVIYQMHEPKMLNYIFVAPCDIHAITLLHNGYALGDYNVGGKTTGKIFVGALPKSNSIIIPTPSNESQSVLDGKHIDVFGDSIWARDSKTYPATNPPYNTDTVGTKVCSYPTLIREKYKVSVNNYAASGDTILLQMPVILSKTFDDTDIVIISVGVNDFSASEPLGVLPTACGQSFDDTTFIGAYCKCIEHIKTQRPEAKIILCTPLHRDTRWRNNGTPDFSLKATDIYTTNNQGLKLNDYRNAIIGIAELYSCIVADMYAESGINYLTMQIYTSDGIHPINSGYEYTAPIIFKALEKVVC